MTAFTPNAGGTVNWDTLSGGSVNATLDSYAISNGTTLLIDTDSYQCANHSEAFGSVDTVTFTGTGGKLKLDGTNVRVIPYNTGSGNVPAIGTTISQGGVSGTLLGVWASWLVEPTAAAAAMPATGFIKIKNKAGGNFAAGALTGIGASATGADVVGWIEVRGADTATITVPRIGAFEVTGDWFELGTTNGTAGQVIPCPTCATVAGVFPGVWIETSAGSGVYERYAGAGSQVAVAATRTDASMKIVWQTTGGIRIGNNGTNNVGYLPPTGCKVRIPNVIMTCCTRTVSGSGPRVLPNATLATRQEFVTTSAGDISITNGVMNWYGKFLQAFRADIINSALSDTMVLQEIASPLNTNNCIVSPTQAQINAALNTVSCFGGGSVQNSNFWRFSLASTSSYVAAINYPVGVTFSGNVFGSLTLRANATTGVITSTQPKNCTFINNTHIGGQALIIGQQGCTFTNTTYYDHTITTTTSSTNPMYAYSFTTGCARTTVEGILLPLPANGPYAGLVGSNACYDTALQNVGASRSAPLVMNASVTAVAFNGLGNNDGITLKRVYVSNTRTGPYAFVNSDNNILVENVAGDYADTTVMAGLNAVEKSVAITSATTGQTSVYGSHWKTRFTSTTAGFTEITCNEPTTASAAQCAITSGTPQFNSVGQVLMTVVGQQVVWEMPYFAKGYTAFTNSAPTITGTNVTYSSGARWGNHDIEFQIDTGSGYGGTWLALTAANLTAQTINSTTGFRLKIRVTAATASATNAITNMRIAMTTTATDQDGGLYPLVTAPIQVEGLVTGSRVKFSKVSDGTVLYQGTETAGICLFDSNEYTGAVAIEARKASGAPFYQPWVTQVTPAAGATTTATALQALDE